MSGWFFHPSERWAHRGFLHHVGFYFCMQGWFFHPCERWTHGFFSSCGGFSYDVDVMVVVVVFLVSLKFYYCCSVGSVFSVFVK